jgi:hypothetical protein
MGMGGVFVKSKETACTRRGAHRQPLLDWLNVRFPFDAWGDDFWDGLVY